MGLDTNEIPSTIEVSRDGTGRVVMPIGDWPRYKTLGFVACKGQPDPDAAFRLHSERDAEAAGGAQEVDPRLNGLAVPPATPEPDEGGDRFGDEED